MSLCLLMRTSSGKAMMAADSALTYTRDGTPYRVSGKEDFEKVIEYRGNLIFCSGRYDLCVRIRGYIRSLDELDIGKLQAYAQGVFRQEDDPASDLWIVICRRDNSVVSMRGRDNFVAEVTDPLSFTAKNVEATTFGVHADKAFTYARELSRKMPINEEYVQRVFGAVADEEVGGTVSIFYRDVNGSVSKSKYMAAEPPIMRWAHTVPKLHAIIYATGGEFNGVVKAEDFQIHSGGSMVSILNSQGKIKGDFIDAKGINIKNAAGETVVYFDETGIHWTAKYSPIKYQYATSATGPWHDTRSANDEYRRESADGGTTWSDGIKFVAKDGRNGSDADVTYNNIKKALQKAEGIETSFITVDEMGAPNIYGGNIYGAHITGGDITAATKINVGTDAYIGNNLYLGQNSSSLKGITFNQTSKISVGAGDFGGLTLSAPRLTLAATAGADSQLKLESPILDLSGVDKINWGNNKVVACFG